MAGATLTQITDGTGVPWLFLPGGPGMGAQYLKGFAQLVHWDAPLYLVDLPYEQPNLEFYQQTLIDTSRSLGRCLWVGHSFGGMLLQTIPELQTWMAGLILANTAPDNQWFQTFAARASAQNLPNVSKLRKQLLDTPSDELYKSYMLNSIDYYFTPNGITEGLKLFHNCEFHVKPYLWGIEYFHPTYQATYIPQCPTLIIKSQADHMIPLNCFDPKPYQSKPFSQVTIKAAGHFPWIEQPDDVASAIHQWVSSVSLNGAD